MWSEVSVTDWSVSSMTLARPARPIDSSSARRIACGRCRYRVRPSPRASRLCSSRQWQARAAALLAPLALLLAGLVFAAPAAADVLISNIGKTNSGNVSFSGLDSAQGFTTGAHSDGYTLESVEVVAIVALGSNVRVRVTSGTPGGSAIATLTHPPSYAAGTLTFSAPTGTTLAASTTYYVVLDTTANGSVGITAQDTEDSGGAPGWSIENERYESPGTNTWTSQTTSLRIRVNGVAKDLTAPVIQSATVNGDKLRLNYNEALDTNSTPATTDFTVSVAGTDQTPSEVSVSGSAVTLTLGTQVFGQTVTVTYTKGTNPIRDLEENDADALSSQAVTNNNASPATIDLVRIVSAPTYDADSDGTRDTFVRGDKILVDVEYSVPVSVTGRPRLRLQLGDSATLADNRKSMNKESELHGGRTLRFAYTVAASDTDTTGVWVETSGSNKTVVFLPGGATIKSAENGAAAGLTRTGLATSGDSLAKVDGAKTTADTGPRPTGATVNGATLEVTYNRALDTSVDKSKLPLYFGVYGTELSGGHRNAYQHPSTVAFAAGDNTKLVLTLGEPARAGDTVTLSYKLNNYEGPLEDTNDKMAPAFVDLAVTNNTPGTAGPAPSGASVRARTLQLVFDGDLDEASTPAGSAFLVETKDLDGDRRSIPGTGTATVSGATVTVQLDADEEPVGADDLVRVSYTPPTSNPLQNADGDDVLAFERFRVETVLDGIPPAFAGGEAMQTSSSPATSKVVIYFDEPLDTSSVPVAANFPLLVGGSLATISSIAVEGDAVTLTLSRLLAGGTVVSLGYGSGSGTILDLAGNAAAGFSHAITAATAATPVLQTSGTDAPAVDGASLTLTYDLPLDPAKVPSADRYTLHYQLASGETDRDEYPRNTAAVAVRNKKIVLRLDAPVYPCDPEPTVSYAQKTGGPNVQGIDGQAAAAISHEVVANKRKTECTNSQGVSINSGGQGKSVALKFRRTLDTGRALQASAFRLAGASAPSVAGAAYTADAAGVALTLDRALAPGETVEARYERPVGEPGLWDTEGEQIADFSGVAVPVRNSGPPAVTGVEVVSDSGNDDTYALGETIRVRVTFSEAVEVDTAGGTPRLAIDMDPARWGTKRAAHEGGSGTASLTFAYEVVQPNLSTQGIAVLADTLEANGGAIRSASEGTDAQLGHDGLDHDPAHKVDWRLTPAPAGALTAAFVGMPAEHNGKKLFGFEIRFSEEFRGLRLTALKAGALQVAGGRLVDAKRTVRGQNRSVTVRVRPASFEDVTITLAATTDCAAATAICTADGRKLENTATGTVLGPALLSVADARATEGVDSAVEFAVTLSRAASDTVTVDYATADGTATAGEDYTATSGTLTFAAGETAKTVAVPVLDDAHDEGEETFRFRLSNAQGAVIADREAVGTIVNEDRMPRAWLARFGRTAWEHTLDAVQHRLDGAGNAATRAAVAGREMRAATADPGADDARQLAALAAWIDGSEEPLRTVSVPELLAGSAFQVAASADEAGGGLTLWGQGAYGRFEGRDGDLSVDGEVVGATLGVDYATGPWLAGLALSHSSGWGSYAQPAARGEVTGALTGAFPYVGVEVVPERLALWVAGGYGVGSQRLTPAGATALESPIDLLAGAAGVRGTVVAAPAAGGFSLGLTADGSLLRATSVATTGLAAATADVDRVRLGLEGSYEVALGGGAWLTPSVEVGVRRDGGAAETGFGMDMGGGLRFAHPGLGLSLGLSGRALVVHETADLAEWGAGGSLSWDPNPASDLGPALTVAPSIGASAHGGAATLWSRQTLAGLDGAAGATAAGRVDARFAYGVPLAGGVAAPWAGIRFSEGAREYRLGHVFRLGESSASDLRIELTATRREPTGAEPEHAISVQSTVRW